MVRQYGMSRATVREGIALLVQEGILARRRGAGTFIQSLKPRKPTRLLAAMVPCQPGRWDSFGKIIQQVENCVHDRGNSLIICNHENNREKIERYLDRIIQDDVAGVIFSPVQLPGHKDFNIQVIRRLEDHNLPFVLIASPVSRDTLSHYSFVSSNGFEATRQIVRHLVGLGHRRIAYISGFLEVFSAEERQLGFLEEMRRNRLDVPDAFVQSIQVEPMEHQGREELRRFLDCRPAPTAVICVHDGIARNVIEEARTLNLKVPDDLAVVGFDNVYYAATLDPPLTTVNTPLADEAAMVAQILFDKIDGNLTGERQEFLACELIVRKSCGAGKSDAKVNGVSD